MLLKGMITNVAALDFLAMEATGDWTAVHLSSTHHQQGINSGPYSKNYNNDKDKLPTLCCIT